MSQSSRRTLLRFIGLCAVAPPWAGRAAGRLARANVFAPPEAPMLYTRRLVRALRGGQQMSVTRSFLVRFTPRAAGGYELLGEQVSVEVVAPDKMAPFAEIERSRVETGVFPLQLGASGLIEGGPQFAPSDLLDQALAEARRLMPTVRADSRGEAEAFLQSVHQAGSALAAHLPDDLFAPAEHRSDRRVIPLPGGDSGEVEVRFTADADPDTGLMRYARREIVTVVGDDRRSTEEEWTLRLA